MTMRRVFSVITFYALTSFALNSHASECKPVYLTFDSGTMRDAEYIKTTLKKEKVKATFFITNKRTTRNSYTLDPSWSDYWKSLVADGHQFGNHTWSHHYARFDRKSRLHLVTIQGKKISLDKKQYCTELARVNQKFHQLTGKNLSGIWRAPAGRVTQQSIRWAAECGYPVHIHWSRNGYLGDDLPSEQYSNHYLLTKALKNIRPGEILIMHMGVYDRKQSLAPILPELIKTLKARNYCFRTISQGGVNDGSV